MSDAPTTLLEYASPAAARQPWGPVFFRASLRSLILFCFTAAAVTWLSLRHNPWRRVGTIPADYHLKPLFTHDNQLLTFDTLAGVHLYDPATGRIVRTVLPTIDTNIYRYFVLGGGQQILALPFVDRVALLYDVSSGRIVEARVKFVWLPTRPPLKSMPSPKRPCIVIRGQRRDGSNCTNHSA